MQKKLNVKIVNGKSLNEDEKDIIACYQAMINGTEVADSNPYKNTPINQCKLPAGCRFVNLASEYLEELEETLAELRRIRFEHEQVLIATDKKLSVTGRRIKEIKTLGKLTREGVL